MPASDLDLRPTGATTAVAMTQQELFWHLMRAAPDASGLLATVRIIRGPLDRDALIRSFAAVVEGQSVLRTTYREIAGRLHQTVPPLDRAAPCELEYVDRAPLPEAQWDAELAVIRLELAAGLDAATGRVLRARLVRFAPDEHALALSVHHIATDVTALSQLVEQLFAAYTADRAGRPLPTHTGLQLIDVADAFARWHAAPAGRAAAAFFQQRLGDAPAITVPNDVPRADVDRRRDAAPLGLTAEPMLVPVGTELSAAVRAAIDEHAAWAQCPLRTAYIAALFRMLQLETGQTDLCIDAPCNQRPLHPALADVHGSLLTAMIYRVDVAGCTSLRDVLARTAPAIAEADAHVHIEDYYRVVPHAVRRVVFNHVPMTVQVSLAVGELVVELRRMPMARWKRSYDLQALVIDTPAAPLAVWTGADTVFSRERIAALQQRYLDLFVG